MIQDAGIRLKFINTLLETIDKVIEDSFNHLCTEMAYENSLITDLVNPKMFMYRATYYPDNVQRGYSKLILSRTVSKIHEDLIPQFESIYQTYVKEYNLFRGKYKSMLSELCRHAVSIDCFSAVLTDSLMRDTHELSYVAMRSAKGISDIEAFTTKYKEVIEKAVYYISIRQLI